MASGDERLLARATVHAALADPVRLAIAEELVTSDRAPKELGALLNVPSNQLAHHLDVLERAGLIDRTASAGDRRRKYVRLVHPIAAAVGVVGHARLGATLFVCSHNSARSQLAAAMWTARTGRRASSAGTRPSAQVHRGAVAAARRAGLSLADARPRRLDTPPPGVQVVTVCDVAHEELEVAPEWWHWSIPDPVELGDRASFDAVVDEIDERIAAVIAADDRGAA